MGRAAETSAYCLPAAASGLRWWVHFYNDLCCAAKVARMCTSIAQVGVFVICFSSGLALTSSGYARLHRCDGQVVAKDL
ncbi:hypothetical protein BDV12DRAFT_108270 [Aspergillus spectabilis]